MLNKWETKTGELVCALDIDGVMNFYPKPWVEFINRALGTNYANLVEAKKSVPYQTYKDLKYNYRECGIKAHLEMRPGLSEFTKRLHEMQYKIIVISSRPFDEHKSLFQQTIQWFESGDVAYDGLIFSKEKHIKVLMEAPHLKFMVEDHRYFANLVAQWGYKVFLMDNEYNQGGMIPGVTRVFNFSDILSNLEEVKRWPQ